MKRWTRLALFAAVAAAAACAPRERTIVVLSTNDMHAKIQHFPRLAAAVEACRDTVPDALLVDAGDRWTGNAYVDKTAVPGKPVIELMNRLRYDVATLGNHEFDHGQAFLGRMIDSMDFEVVCANVLSDTCTFPQLPAATIVERGGVKIGFVGAVTNYEGPGHPAGNAASFAGLEFPDPQAEAIRRAEELRGRVDVLVLVSHMGDDRDEELLGRTRLFDLVIGGHTHVLRDTVVNGTLLTQTGKDLRYVGVTEIRLRGGKVQSADFRLVPLDGYGPDAGFAAEVERYYASPELNRPVGAFAATMDKQGLANWMAAAVADEADAEVGFYHIGGVRLDSLAGEVVAADIYNLDPFGSKLVTAEMTADELARLVKTKFNDTVNLDESHRIDIYMTTPYVIRTDERFEAQSVAFPELKPGRRYRVAMGDYIFKTYSGLDYTDGAPTGTLLTDVLDSYLRARSPLAPDNEPRQRIE